MTTVPNEINAAAAKSSATEKHTPMMQRYVFPITTTQP
jgi:hypothetical protein